MRRDPGRFQTLLIANRGEIACRIARTAQRMGLRTIAVYSEADAHAAHVAAADEAYFIGPAPAARSYLDRGAILDAARRSGAEAIHPGYGFLSENAGFAEAVAAAGLIFVGPPAEAIRTLGSKSAAKALMEKAGVPLVPGYHGEGQEPGFLAREAEAIGYPVLIKASAGGGGKGMRIVREAGEFAAALDSARRESQSAFGDDRMLIEKFLERPRHIEIQIFADKHGNAVHLFERDCSVQRRYQKVLEEAPAPGLDQEMRERMGVAGVTAAQASGYVGAGTVEFITEGDRFYFMEMNTRLQVEHPVTEFVTGQDLVEWQLRVAAGEPLPLDQSALAIHGHAIEARIYAEDPDRDFLPSTGRLRRLRFPAQGPHLRIDSGVREGDEVSVHYDPMIGKLIVWDRDRGAALARLRGALRATQIAGPTTNIEFLAAIAAHPSYAEGAVGTGFIGEHREALLPERGPGSDAELAVACLAVLLRRRKESQAAARRSTDPFSPWARTDGWRLNMDTQTRLLFRDGEDVRAVVVTFVPDGYRFALPGGEVRVSGDASMDGSMTVQMNGRRFAAAVDRDGTAYTVMLDGRARRLTLITPFDSLQEDALTGGRINAPMPGKVVKVFVKTDQVIARGAPLAIMEAMKMEHTLTAPFDGVVSEMNCAAGDVVEEGADLMTVSAESEAEG